MVDLSTNLQKHFATVCAVYSNKAINVENFADFFKTAAVADAKTAFFFTAYILLTSTKLLKVASRKKILSKKSTS
jgi:hypothetical protein